MAAVLLSVGIVVRCIAAAAACLYVAAR